MPEKRKPALPKPAKAPQSVSSKRDTYIKKKAQAPKTPREKDVLSLSGTTAKEQRPSRESFAPVV